jgi:AcrR family transcriptional regulator
MSRAESKARTRQLLADAATEVFAEKGFNAATVEEIVERAGFTRGAFYANWPDKTELMWELADAQAEVMFEGLTEALARPLDETMDAFQSWFDRLLEPRPLQRAFNELMSAAADSPEGRARLARIFANERRAIAGALEHMEQVLGEELPIPPEHFAAIGFAIGNGLAQQHLVDPEAVPSTLFGDAQAYLWFGVLAATQSGDFSPRTGTRKRRSRPPGGTRS